MANVLNIYKHLRSHIIKKKKAPRDCLLGLFFDWLLDYQDSNLDKQNQNLLCYHYTIVQTLCAFLEKQCKDKSFDSYNPNIFSVFFQLTSIIITFALNQNHLFILWI